MFNTKSKKIYISILFFIFLCVLIFIGFINKIISFNSLLAQNYPVKGIDVSSHQGNIDWNILSSQGINFAFIKATEGSSFVDNSFKMNWKNAHKTHLKIGAYHFFSYDSSGLTQAQNFIDTVGQLKDDNLPPVIDVEFYADKEKELPIKEHTKQILDELILTLTKYYKRDPIIYATQKAYNLYIKNGYPENPIWIRNVFYKPQLPDNREWIFWQYNDKVKLDGHQGKGKYIDMNVFNGSEYDFIQFMSGD